MSFIDQARYFASTFGRGMFHGVFSIPRFFMNDKQYSYSRLYTLGGVLTASPTSIVIGLGLHQTFNDNYGAFAIPALLLFCANGISLANILEESILKKTEENQISQNQQSKPSSIDPWCELEEPEQKTIDPWCNLDNSQYQIIIQKRDKNNERIEEIALELKKLDEEVMHWAGKDEEVVRLVNEEKTRLEKEKSEILEVNPQ